MKNETLLKPRHKLSIVIYSALLIAVIYLSYTKFWEQRMAYVFGGVLIFLLISDILKQSKKYVLKINDDLVSYKDDKKKNRWNKFKSLNEKNNVEKPCWGAGTPPDLPDIIFWPFRILKMFGFEICL